MSLSHPRQLVDLGSIGPAMLKDFALLGIRTVEQLAQCEAQVLYDRLCRLTNGRQDPCVLDTFTCAIAQARDPQLPAEQRQWWYWSRLRKQAAVAVGVLVLQITAHAASSEPISAYTDLTKCKITDSSDRHQGEPDANPDFFKSTCPSFAGYRIFHDGGDARSWLVIKRGTLDWKTRDGLWEKVPGHFPQITGTKIEWRLAPGAKEPYALILRMGAQDEETMKDLQWLAVLRTRPAKIDVVGVIKASGNPQANQQARDLADREARP